MGSQSFFQRRRSRKKCWGELSEVMETCATSSKIEGDQKHPKSWTKNLVLEMREFRLIMVKIGRPKVHLGLKMNIHHAQFPY